MLIFSTKLYVKSELTDEKFINMASEWVTQGKNYTFGKVEWDGSEDFAVTNLENTQSLRILKYDNAVIVNLVNKDGGIIWTNDYVLTEKDGKRILAVMLYNDAENLSVKLPKKFNRPRLLKQIIRENLGGNDNGRDICDTVFKIDVNNAEKAESLIKKDTKYFMPVVYVTPMLKSGEYSLDYEELAKDLAGVAHVWVEEDYGCTSVVRNLTDGKNPYDGAVQVFYPGGTSQRILPAICDNKNLFRENVAYSVFTKLILSRIDSEFSWTKIKYDMLAKENRENIDLAELSEKLWEEERNKVLQYEEKVEELEREVTRLQMKLSNYEYRFNRNSEKNNVAVSLMSWENDLYENEIQDFVLRVLKRELNLMKDDANQRQWRKYHILESLIKCNNETGKSDEISKEIKEILSSDGIVEQKRRLEDIGFEFEQGKHYKARYKGDHRYMVTISRSSSDKNHGDMNLASEIRNTIFE